jgi:hypothetical protein
MIEHTDDVKTARPKIVELNSARALASGVRPPSRRKRRSRGTAVTRCPPSFRPLTVLSAGAGEEMTGPVDLWSDAPSSQSIAERCDEQIAALYVLAYIRLGQHEAAETAVVEAIARAAGLPPEVTCIPVSVWRLLATHFHGDDRRCSPTGSML